MHKLIAKTGIITLEDVRPHYCENFEIYRQSEDGNILVTYDLTNRNAAIALRNDLGQWFDTGQTQDWGYLDQVIGRDSWKSQLTEIQEEGDAIANQYDKEDEEED